MAYYNWRVFGDPLTLPYITNRRTYAVAPVFLWQTPGAIPNYNHQALRDFFVGYELRNFLSFYDPPYGGISNLIVISVKYWMFFLYPLLSLVLLFGFHRLVMDRQSRIPTFIVLLPAAGVSVGAFFMSHYIAPAAACIYFLLARSLHLIREQLAPSRGMGLAFVRNVVFVAFIMACLAPAHVSSRFRAGANMLFVFPQIQGRAEAIRFLQHSPGQDLVLVRYGPGHDPFLEWVYNNADIDASGIVWAREMTPDRNREILQYFAGRRAWLLLADEKPPRLTPYPNPH
jgi:hypothetical protein